MTNLLSITTLVVGITTATIESVKFLYTIISDIKDISTTLENIRLDL